MTRRACGRQHRGGRIISLQLPLLDNDVSSLHENLPLAGRCLAHSLAASRQGADWKCTIAGPWAGTADDRELLRRIVARRPAMVAFTIYLWNVERSLRIMAELKRRRPALKILVGGPEVARHHPFLFASLAWDYAVCGEGEGVFPAVVRAAAANRPADFEGVVTRVARGFRWGRRRSDRTPLPALLPPPASPLNAPDARGVACIESSRGCPHRCSFCRYSARTQGLAWLTPAEVAARVEVLMARGAREIRFVDPMFNAAPSFEPLLDALAALNRRRRVRFFAEVRCDRISRRQAGLLAKAGFREVEAGLQTTNPRVLRDAGRPTRLAAFARGMRHLTSAGIRVTLDLMCGLPGQRPADVRRDLRWALRFDRRRTRIQFLHTLLLPGTRLRAEAGTTGLVAQALPPYRVLRTATMTADELTHAEKFAQERAGIAPEHGTERFVGTHLPDLFPERVHIRVPVRQRGVPGTGNRRAAVFTGRNLYGHRAGILKFMRRAMAVEPHIGWQFVLRPREEEPLDLLEEMTAVVDAAGECLLDRMVVSDRTRVRAGRRVMVLLDPSGAYSRSWRAAAEAWLRERYV